MHMRKVKKATYDLMGILDTLPYLRIRYVYNALANEGRLFLDNVFPTGYKVRDMPLSFKANKHITLTNAYVNLSQARLRIITSLRVRITSEPFVKILQLLSLNFSFYRLRQGLYVSALGLMPK
uniref:Uncharacterized protein n=1 Tax=Glossina pallidipes TaxID=7398 RepID=A0A1B0A1F3_GLOPL